MTYTRDSAIRGTGTVSAEAIQAWFVARGPAYKGYAPNGQYEAPPANLGAAIVAECRRYPDQIVNHDLLAAQILHETAAWQSEYARERNNPGGIGAINSDPDQALWFETPEDGVRCHVAHMLNYVHGRGAWSVNDPRGLPDGYYGVVDVLKDLEQRWAWSPPVEYAATAPDKRYGGMLAKHANALVTFANDGSWEPPMVAQIPGFKWYPADADHYERGRGEKIRGGAQHYTAGTNSLEWLARNSTPPVSVHFLVKHEPTMDDRGWQLVRIEDTSWTTAFANPYTVAIEYEHKQGQSISDTAYAVLAQTWKDIAGYVTAKGIGNIPLTRAGIRGHKEWVNNPQLVCPDGIDVDRIVREAQGSTPPPTDWPTVPPAVPDPHRTSNPFGRDFWVPKQFAVLMASTPFQLTGFVMEGAREWVNPEGETLIIQHTERQRYELHQDGSVTLGRLGAEALGGGA
jgi:hypothetical protein